MRWSDDRGRFSWCCEPLSRSQRGETISFAFAAPEVEDVEVQFSFLNQGVAIDIEAFSLGGVSLGTVTVDPPPPLLVDVSALFGDVPVESLDLTAIGSTLRVGGIDFTAVPEPASALLLAFGLVGLAARPRGGPRRRSSH